MVKSHTLVCLSQCSPCNGDYCKPLLLTQVKHVSKVVFHNPTMVREGPPTIQNRSIPFDSPECVCGGGGWYGGGGRESSCFQPSAKFDKIWIYLKLTENKNWHVVPSKWSIIEQKYNQSNIFVWYPLEEIGKNIVVIFGSIWNSAVRGHNQAWSFPACHWLFPTCHLSSSHRCL